MKQHDRRHDTSSVANGTGRVPSYKVRGRGNTQVRSSADFRQGCLGTDESPQEDRCWILTCSHREWDLYGEKGTAIVSHAG